MPDSGGNTPSTYALSFSTDDIFRGGDTNRCLSDDLDTIETNITTLQTGKADTTHTHSNYLTEDDLTDTFALASHTHSDYLTENDATDSFALINHTHTEYAASAHAHTDLASATHTHAQADITGLVAKLAEIDEAITDLEDATSTEVQPLLTASMHLGKLDNNSGAESTSTTRICSDPFAIQNGKSYWQVNDKAVNMYVLIYDSDEVFLEYLGNFASGAEIEVTNANAAYMKIGSLVGEYDLTNVFRIYDVDPSSGAASDYYTKTESDARYSLASHTHTDLHSHTNKTVLDGITSEKVSAWDSAASTPSIDAYTKTESDARYATTSHTHSDYMTSTTANSTFSPITHTHAGFAAQNHTHSYNDLTDLPSTSNTYEHPSTHPVSMITGLSDVATSGSYNDLIDKPTSMAANGGDADTVGGNYPSAFASASHTHDNYLPLSGGALTGNLNVGGILRVNNQQAVYDGGTMITLSTNNRETMIAGSKVYSKTTITVSSDERLKENIAYADPDQCLDFINDLEVKTFNYVGDNTPCMGVIAQDLQDSDFADFFVFTQPGEEKYLAVKAADLVFPLIAAVQNLSAEIDYLKAMI